MRGQSYDGASAMFGDEKGAQALIKEKNPLALYTHCRSHILSLVIDMACKVQVLRNMVDLIEEVGRQRADFGPVWSSWITRTKTITADVGGEIAIPRRAKRQIDRANTPADTARYIFCIDLTCIYFYRFNFLVTTLNCYD